MQKEVNWNIKPGDTVWLVDWHPMRDEGEFCVVSRVTSRSVYVAGRPALIQRNTGLVKSESRPGKVYKTKRHWIREEAVYFTCLRLGEKLKSIVCDLVWESVPALLRDTIALNISKVWSALGEKSEEPCNLQSLCDKLDEIANDYNKIKNIRLHKLHKYGWRIVDLAGAHLLAEKNDENDNR